MTSEQYLNTLSTNDFTVQNILNTIKSAYDAGVEDGKEQGKRETIIHLYTVIDILKDFVSEDGKKVLERLETEFNNYEY